MKRRTRVQHGKVDQPMRVNTKVVEIPQDPNTLHYLARKLMGIADHRRRRTAGVGFDRGSTWSIPSRQYSVPFCIAGSIRNGSISKRLLNNAKAKVIPPGEVAAKYGIESLF